MMPQTTYFEDVAPGAEIAPLMIGPLTPPLLMRWSAAMENWHRIHYDRTFAVEHDKLPDLLVNGTLKQQLILQHLRRWVGPEGWAWKVSFQFRSMNLVGETLRMWARVARTHELPDYGLVALDLGILNDKDAESTPGKAVAAIPYRSRDDARGVPYPFTPPEVAGW